VADTFNVGDRAVIIASCIPTWPVGKEVEILSPLEPCGCVFFCDQMVHVIGHEGGLDVVSLPSSLRKIPPKQDWKTLCHLTDLPQGVPEHV
jgi:hypothetical protein